MIGLGVRSKVPARRGQISARRFEGGVHRPNKYTAPPDLCYKSRRTVFPHARAMWEYTSESGSLPVIIRGTVELPNTAIRIQLNYHYRAHSSICVAINSYIWGQMSSWILPRICNIG